MGSFKGKGQMGSLLAQLPSKDMEEIALMRVLIRSRSTRNKNASLLGGYEPSQV